MISGLSCGRKDDPCSKNGHGKIHTIEVDQDASITLIRPPEDNTDEHPPGKTLPASHALHFLHLPFDSLNNHLRFVCDTCHFHRIEFRLIWISSLASFSREFYENSVFILFISTRICTCVRYDYIRWSMQFA